MTEHPLPIATDHDGVRTLHAIRPEALAAFRAGLTPEAAASLDDAGFTGQAQQLALLAGGAAVLGLGEDRSPYAFGELAMRLPEGSAWQIAAGDHDPAAAALGFCLGAYSYRGFKPPRREPARLAPQGDQARALAAAEAAWMVRDLVNTPPNLLGPAELADAALALAARFGAAPRRVEGTALDDSYPAIAAVGAGSARPPVVAGFAWRGSAAGDDAPLVSLCGKGVVFDSGGYDLKPSAAMLRMKKDMGGAATVLGMARMVMQADLPIRLAVSVGCVENSVSGQAMRPSDVIRTRRGLSVEIGNTDAEGRLVLCDLLAEASDERPALLLDCATLTGAARVALGPDIPGLFASDDELAAGLMAAGRRCHDPVWALPLWDGYDSWLDSPVADLNNVATKPFAGAVVAALFLRRFLAPGTRWAHLDLYAWNDAARPGRPEGGEAQSLRAVYDFVEREICRFRTVRP